MFYVFCAVDNGHRIVMWQNDSLRTNDFVLLDADDGRVLKRIALGPACATGEASPDGKLLSVESSQTDGLDVAWTWLSDHHLPGPKPNRFNVDLFDAETGRRAQSLPSLRTFFAPDGRSIISMRDQSPTVLELWDVPPRKPLTWFAAAAGGLALPLAGWAGYWSRRLRQKAA
jgi:hypothetical protein